MYLYSLEKTIKGGNSTNTEPSLLNGGSLLSKLTKEQKKRIESSNQLFNDAIFKIDVEGMKPNPFMQGHPGHMFQGSGTGFFIGQDIAVTAEHVIKDARLISSKSKNLLFEVKYSFPDYDLAVLRIINPMKSKQDGGGVQRFLPIFEGDVMIQQQVVKPGFPRAVQKIKVHHGQISGIEHGNYVCTNPSTHGDSGACLLVEDGSRYAAIGVISHGYLTGNTTYAIPLRFLKNYIREFKLLEHDPHQGWYLPEGREKQKLFRAPKMGVRFQINDTLQNTMITGGNPTPNEHFLQVRILQENSPFQKNNIPEGARITNVDGFPVNLEGELVVTQNTYHIPPGTYSFNDYLRECIRQKPLVVTYKMDTQTNVKEINLFETKKIKFEGKEYELYKPYVSVFRQDNHNDFFVIGGMIVKRIAKVEVDNIGKLLMTKQDTERLYELYNYEHFKNRNKKGYIVLYKYPGSIFSNLSVGDVFVMDDNTDRKDILSFKNMLEISDETDIKDKTHIFLTTTLGYSQKLKLKDVANNDILLSRQYQYQLRPLNMIIQTRGQKLPQTSFLQQLLGNVKIIS